MCLCPHITGGTAWSHGVYDREQPKRIESIAMLVCYIVHAGCIFSFMQRLACPYRNPARLLKELIPLTLQCVGAGIIQSLIPLRRPVRIDFSDVAVGVGVGVGVGATVSPIRGYCIGVR